MRKLLSVLLAGALMFGAVGALAACNKSDASAIDDKIEAAASMTEDELIAEAAKETGKFVAYGNSSRIVDAMNGFITKYGTKLNLTSNDATASKQSDTEIFTLIENEAKATDKSKNASMVLIHDSASLNLYRSGTDYFANYVPASLGDNISEADTVPLAQQYINKLFIWNNQGNDVPTFSNVWELTNASYKGKIYFKSPNSEQVNMNFLIMLTNDEWSGKLKDAYVDLNGAEATDVGSGKTYENYGYKWITEFIANCNFTINSDTTMAQSLSKPENAGNMGLFVLSKLRDESVTTDNLQVAAWNKNSSDQYIKIEPFAGFMYALYAQLASYGPRPYTAMLFINYLMTEEGFSPWATLGGYSSNSSIAVTDGDSTLSFWRDNLVFEDGAYIVSVKTKVEDYVNKLL